MPVSEFFNVQPLQVALTTLFTHWKPQVSTEMLDPRHALGRVLAKPCHSPIDLPEFPRSTVDGYAVRAHDTFGASQALPAYLTCIGTIPMGAAAMLPLAQGQAMEIHTGGMLPPQADAVVMIEHSQLLGENEIEVLAPVAPGENVIQIGEDVTKNLLILPAGCRLRPQDIGALLAVGILTVEVVVPPRVGILSCGDELVTPESTPAPGQIRDINAYTLAALVKQAGGEVVLCGIAQDRLEDYLEYAQAAFAQTDLLILTAGSSISTRDLTRAVINRLGSPGVLQHGLAVKPGKPTILAVCDGSPVIGLPGNPVSALLVAHQVVLPLLHYFLGESPPYTATIRATLAANIASTTGREDTVPVRLIERNGQLFAEPVLGKSNLIYTLVHADGVVRVPLNSNGIPARTAVDVLLFNV
jgi:molybdopterin molybdotransferase